MKTQNTGTALSPKRLWRVGDKTQIKTKSTDTQNHKRFGFFVFDKFVFYLCFVSLGSVLFAVRSAFASNHLTNQPGINLSIQDVLRIVTGLACWITSVVLVLMVVAVVYFGVKFLLAQGDPTKLTDAKKSFLWGLVGILVILGTYTIIATVAYSLGITDTSLIIPLSCPAF